MKISKLAVLCLALLLFALLAPAQEVTGSIYGTVTDASGGALPNARVIVTHMDRNAVIRELLTNEFGQYSATLLPVGRYEVAVEAIGFKRAAQRHIEVDANDRAAASFVMELGDIA